MKSADCVSRVAGDSLNSHQSVAVTRVSPDENFVCDLKTAQAALSCCGSQHGVCEEPARRNMFSLVLKGLFTKVALYNARAHTYTQGTHARAHARTHTHTHTHTHTRTHAQSKHEHISTHFQHLMRNGKIRVAARKKCIVNARLTFANTQSNPRFSLSCLEVGHFVLSHFNLLTGILLFSLLPAPIPPVTEIAALWHYGWHSFVVFRLLY